MESMIKENFILSDVEDILNTPLGDAESKDEIISKLDKKN